MRNLQGAGSVMTDNRPAHTQGAHTAMTTGFLVNPDLSRRTIEFELEHANQFLGGTTEDRVSVAFQDDGQTYACLLYTSPSPRDGLLSRMPSSA